jgi:hypothetical protein
MVNSLSQAIVHFLGYGSAFAPQRNHSEPPALLDLEVEALLQKLSRIEVDWSLHNLVSAGKMARASMQQDYPGLTDAALDALEWKFTYDWR